MYCISTCVPNKHLLHPWRLKKNKKKKKDSATRKSVRHWQAIINFPTTG